MPKNYRGSPFISKESKTQQNLFFLHLTLVIHNIIKLLLDIVNKYLLCSRKRPFFLITENIFSSPYEYHESRLDLYKKRTGSNFGKESLI